VFEELVQLERMKDPALQIEHVCGALEPPRQNEPLGHARNDAPLKYWPAEAPVKHTLLPAAEIIPLLQGEQVPLPLP